MTRISRRLLMRGGLAAGMLVATGMAAQARAPAGTLRIAAGGSAMQGTFAAVLGQGAIFDCLTEISASGELTGELAQSWEGSSDARVWTLALRRGVTFHDGSPFGAGDVLASVARHRAGLSPLPDQIADVAASGPHEVRITLTGPNPDFPFLLADPALVIRPAHLPEGWIGTGLYRLDSLSGGRAELSRVASHYKDGRAGWFNRISLRAENDAGARADLLLAGAVDVIGGVDPALLPALQEAGHRLRRVGGNQFLSIEPAPGLPRAVSDAIKLGIDRPALVAEMLAGHGRVGLDAPIGPLNSYRADLPRPHDPARARAIIAAAGLTGDHVPLFAGPAVPRAFRAAVAACLRDIGLVPVDGAADADGGLTLRRCSGRMTEDWALSAGHGLGALARDPAFIDQRRAAREMRDTDRRAALYRALQQTVATQGAVVIPVHADYLIGHRPGVMSPDALGALGDLDNGRIAERWWFA